MESCQEENKIRVTWDDTIKNCYAIREVILKVGR